MKKIFEDLFDQLGKFLMPKVPPTQEGNVTETQPVAEEALAEETPAPMTEPEPEATDNVDLPELPEIPQSVRDILDTPNVPDPVVPEPVKPNPVKPEPVKPEPVKPEPVKPQPVKPQGPKLDMRPAGVQNLENASKIAEFIAGQLGDYPDLEKKTLCMISDVDLVLERLKSQAFKTQVDQTMAANTGKTFAAVVVVKRDPAKHSGALEIAPHVWFTVPEATELNPDPVPIPRRIAAVTFDVIPGTGSLVGGPVTITEGGTYNIGRGKAPQLDNGALRINVIAVDDNPDGPYIEAARYVARDHAKVLVKPESGVYLFAEQAGTSLAGRRTKILRGSTESPLENPQMPRMLQNGDVIALSKHVLISVSITFQN